MFLIIPEWCFRLHSEPLVTIVTNYSCNKLSKNTRQGALTPCHNCDINYFLLNFLSKNAWFKTMHIWSKIESLIELCLCKYSRLFIISIKNETKKTNLICSIEKYFGKHLETITKTSRAILNKPNCFTFSFSLIFHRFLILLVTLIEAFGVEKLMCVKKININMNK